MNGSDLLVIVGLPLAALAVALLFGVIVPRLRRRHRRNVPFVIAPFHHSGDVPPRPVRNQPIERPAGTQHAPGFPQPHAYAPPVTPGYSPPIPSTAGASPVIPTRETRETREPWMPAPPRREVATGTDGAPRQESRTTAPAARADDHPSLRLEHTPEARRALKVHRPPTDGTLQFLPGRMEVIEGRDIGQEIRFVRQPGVAQTEITFGRGDGAPYRHVQLHEPTVSRLHAKITQDDKRWRLTNLSRTNPVVVNGRPLEGEGASHLLADGDRVEMGEVALRFRAK